MGAPALNLSEFWGPLHRQGFTGAGMTVGVIDTGADAETYERARKLNEYARRYTGFSVQWGLIEKLWPPDNVGTDDLKHGSKVFVRLLGGAPTSFFLDIRTFRPNCSEEELLQAVRVSMVRGVDVLNLSLARVVPMLRAGEHVQSCKVCELTNRLASDQDILVIAAVGNWADQAIGCPSLGENVLAVGSALTDAEKAFYRQRPEQQFRDFIEGRASTSFAAAMVSAQYAVLRSAFPAISADDWVRFVHANRAAASGRSLNFTEPPGRLFSELRPICGGWAANYADWKEFGMEGISNRRELLTRAFSSGVKGYPNLREWLTTQREQFHIFIEGLSAPSTTRFRRAVRKFLPRRWH